MKNGALNDAVGARESELARRCAELGLPIWRIDRTGVIRNEPPQSGPIGLWLVSAGMTARVRDAAATWAEQERPEPIETFNGCWLIPIPERARRVRVGYFVVQAFGPNVNEAPEFVELCHEAQLAVSAVSKMVCQLATVMPDEVQRLTTTLEWLCTDLDRLDRDERTITGFTAQLTDAYETIHALYSVGRSMSDVARPDRFVRELVQRLFDTTQFGWVLCRLVVDERLSPEIRGGMFSMGGHGLSRERLNGALALLEEACIDADSNATVILDASGAIPSEIGPQVVVQPIKRDGQILGLVAAGSKIGHDTQVSSYETLLFEAAGGYLRAFLENVALYNEQQTTFIGTVKALTASIDAKDRYTRGHSERVAAVARSLAVEAGLGRDAAERIHIAGLVHDVGKIGVPENVLAKPGRLTDQEFDLIKAHPEIGFRILRDIPSLRDVLPGVLHHHERWDGRGYPHGLEGEQIPLMARVIGLADAFDAMSSTRSYRPAMSREQVLAEIENCAGSQFDSHLVQVFRAVSLDEYDRMVVEHADADRDRPAA